MIPLQTFCITLPECPERTQKAKDYFRKLNLDVRFFHGIHAEKFGLRTVFPYEVDHPGSGWNMGPKPTGCFLSHFMLWSALNLLHDDIYMVLEDDCKFSEDWHYRLGKALADVPKDFDLLYPGSCCTVGKPTEHIKGEVFDCRYPFSSQCYVVAKKAIPFMLATQRKVYGPVDLTLPTHTFPFLKVYTVLPAIATQFDTDLSP